MYKIFIKDLSFDAIIGILPFEREKPQNVMVDCEIEYEDKKNYIDYAKVVEDLEFVIKEKKFLLLEDALDFIIDDLSTKYSAIKSINLSISKPKILPNCTVVVTKLKNF